MLCRRCARGGVEAAHERTVDRQLTIYHALSGLDDDGFPVGY